MLRLVPALPFADRLCGAMLSHGLQYLLRSGLADEACAVLGAEKTFCGYQIQKTIEFVVVALYVQQGTGLVVVSELRPGPYFKGFIEGADAAGQSDEAIGELGHECLALVHGVHYAEISESGMRHLAANEIARNDSDDLSASVKRGVGDAAHESNGSSAVNQANAILRQQSAEFFGGGSISRANS